jgi:arabinose-5-phosphate isomerase
MSKVEMKELAMQKSEGSAHMCDTEDLLQDLFEQARQYLDHFFDRVDLTQVQKVFEYLFTCKGCAYLSGVGKSGIIAKKIATTLSSCGTKAHFLSPLNALHGDLGVISQGDTVLLFSKSGETDELLQLCPALRNKGAFLIGIVSTGQSRLAKACDLSVILPVEKELCPFDLAPTTSTVVQLLFGDLLAIALMRAKNFTLSEYRQNHPAGRIGKRLTLKVSDIMLKGDALPLCMRDDKLVNVLVELTNKKSGCILIIDEEANLYGIFTDGDLRRALQKHGKEVLERTMSELMVYTPKTTTEETLAFDAMKIMEANQKSAIMMLPVVEGKKLKGLIRLHDLVQSGL